MIISGVFGGVSAIFLSVLLIVYLIMAELGNEKIKKMLLPFTVAIIIVFVIIAIIDIYSVYSRV